MTTLCSILLTVMTTLSNGMFHTTFDTIVNTSSDTCNMVVDSMIYYLQNDPDMLSKKFFGGLGKQKDAKKNAFYLVWKDSKYIPEQQYGQLLLDVLVEDKPVLQDVVIESKVTDLQVDDGRDIRVDIHYSGSMLKEAYGTFHITPMGDNSTKLAMDVHVKFGWFFRIFITRRVYSETIDWRLERFVTNLKLTAEGECPNDAYWENTNH